MSETKQIALPPRARYRLAAWLLFGTVAILALMRFASVFGVWDWGESEGALIAADVVSTVLFQVLGLAVIPLAVLCRFDGRPARTALRDFGFRMPHPFLLVWSAVIGLAMFCITMLISTINTAVLLGIGFMMPRQMPEAAMTVGGFFAAIFTTAICPGFCEEVSDRGLTFHTLKNDNAARRKSDGARIVFIALLFGLFHGNIQQTVYTFCAGLVMATLFVKTRSLFPSIIVHFTNNFLSVYMDFASDRGLPGGDFYTALGAGNVNIVGLAMLALLLSAAILVPTIILVCKRGSERRLREDVESGNVVYDPYTGKAVLAVPPVEEALRVQPQDRVPVYGALILAALMTVGTLIGGLL
ncbi:MAG: CPBP family intramembrane metalloprotease [Clostridiales bacterium]|jgi:membrane protease YdiL (CAAX protease family)|nr:CPBP family intramembrane metalloprotease [Clostridiales bacterium]